MGITKHFTTMQSYLPKYPLVSWVCVSEKEWSARNSTCYCTFDRFKNMFYNWKLLFSREIEQRNYFLRQRTCSMHVWVHFTKNATDVQFSVCGRPRWMWTSAIIVCHYSFQPRQPRKSKVFWLSPLAQKGKKMTRKTKKVRKIIPFIVGSESQVVMEWKKSGMIERQKDECMTGEYDIWGGWTEGGQDGVMECCWI